MSRIVEEGIVCYRTVSLSSAYVYDISTCLFETALCGATSAMRGRLGAAVHRLQFSDPRNTFTCHVVSGLWSFTLNNDERDHERKHSYGNKCNQLINL